MLATILLEKRIYLFIFGIFLLVIIWALTPPRDFPTNTIFIVEEGTSLQSLSDQLHDSGVIRSPFWFRTLTTVLRGEKRLKAGQYYLETPESTLTIAWRVRQGDYDVETVKVTVPEGFTVEKISALFDDNFLLFDNDFFEAYSPEGYLFPDTYFVPLSATASSTIKLMQDNFKRKIAGLEPEIAASGRTLEEIMIMASLLEAEAKTKTDREMASDILWKRLKLGMALQVDSYMWTYEFKGLPENPINNPGLVSIMAAIHPTTTPYLYFLTGHDGQMHYGKTFDEHKVNIQKYLSN